MVALANLANEETDRAEAIRRQIRLLRAMYEVESQVCRKHIAEDDCKLLKYTMPCPFNVFSADHAAQTDAFLAHVLLL